MPLLNDLYKQKIKEALQLALPIIAGQLGQILMGFFDTVQIGGLGQEYIAGSAFANAVFFLTTLFGLGVLFAVSTLVSEVRGENQAWKSIPIYRSGIKISLLLTVVCTALLFIEMHHIEWFMQDVLVNKLALRFLRVAIFSTAFMFVFAAAKQLLDGLGRTKIGMVVTIGGLLLNVALNWALIYGHLGLPKMEIEGAALATTIARGIMMLALLIIIWRDKQIRQLREEYTVQAKEQLSYLSEIFKIGIPAGLQFFFEVAAFNAAQFMAGWLGIKYASAHQIALNLASITFMMLTGISIAGNILTGYAYGARDRQGIIVAGNTVFIITLVMESAFALFFLTCRHLLPLLYTDNAEVISIASSMLVFAAIFQISDGFQSVASGALRGVQDVTIPSIMAFIAYWIIMVPLSYLLAFKYQLGLQGIWIGFIVGLTIAAVALLLRFRWVSKRIEFKEI